MLLIAHKKKKRNTECLATLSYFTDLVYSRARIQTQKSGSRFSAISPYVIQPHQVIILKGKSRIAPWDITSSRHLDPVVVREETKVILILNKNGGQIIY